MPTYIKVLIESGINPDDAFKIAAGQAAEETGNLRPNMKAVQQTLKAAQENQKLNESKNQLGSKNAD